MSEGFVCSNCGREVTAELTKLSGWVELVKSAGDVEEGFTPLTGSTAEIVLSCRCSHVSVEYAPGSISSAWDVPEEWTDA